MKVNLSDISKTLFFHYYPAWVAWSSIYCTVLSSLNWQPELTFISLFIETQLQVLFIYLFIIGSLYYVQPLNNPFRLVTIFAAMIVSVICWEAGSFFIGRQILSFDYEYQLSIAFIALRVFSGCFIIWCFLLAERYCLSELMIREEKIKSLLQEKMLTNNEIKYLKARIDPEFLFEKLQWVLELRDTDPGRVKTEQLDLVRTLRESLAKSK
jgi:hypothetical protein